MELQKRLDGYEPPKLVHLRRRQQYDYTYTLSHARLRDSALGCDIASLASELLRWQVPQAILLFSGLVNKQIGGRTLHYILSALRDAIVDQKASPWAALYAPLGDVGEAKEFPLHCDMYVPELLWNVFEDVPADGSGASMFLRTEVMFDTISAMKSFPNARARKIRSCLESRQTSDRFQWLYDQLHGSWHPWTRELERHFASKRERMVFARGEGYLLHDRRWLHGRERPSGVVSTKRVHRLVFDVDGPRMKDRS